MSKLIKHVTLLLQLPRYLPCCCNWLAYMPISEQVCTCKA